MKDICLKKYFNLSQSFSIIFNYASSSHASKKVERFLVPSKNNLIPKKFN